MAFDFSTLITDRTQQDVNYVIQLIDKLVSGTATDAEEAEWNSFTLKGAYNYTDLNRVTEAMEYLKDLLVSYGYSMPNYKRIKLQRHEHYETQTITKPILPDGYTQLEYIEISDGAVIDTGIVPTNHTISFKYENNTYSNDAHIFGTTKGAGYAHFTTYSNKYYWGRNGSESNGGSWTSGTHELIFNSGSTYEVILDGATLGSGTNITSSSNLLLGKRDSVVSFTCAYYPIEILNKSTNELDGKFIPVKRNSDGSIGLYNLVTSMFVGNSGSGSITAGPENIEYETITEEVLVPDERDPYTWFEDDIPTSGMMAQYITNLSELRGQFVQAETTPSVPTKMDALTWTEANNIEKILEDVDALLTNISAAWFYIGDIFSGEV